MRTYKVAETASKVEARENKMFTGKVWGEVLMPHKDNAGANRVTFGPGSRTAWHRHDGGQMLVGEGGNGLVVTRSGEVTRIFDGIVVHACPKEEHWHGAMPDCFMTHLSCVLFGETEFFDEVTEAEYQEGVEKARSQEL
jgi:quercetin dioxygenase-like cupin family protein